MHLRKGNKEHQEFYHNSQKVVKTKTRWDEEELYLLASEELRLINNKCKAINKELTNKFPHRTMEAIKGVRRQTKYKQLLDRLRDSELERNLNGEESNSGPMKNDQENRISDISPRSSTNPSISMFWENNHKKELDLLHQWSIFSTCDMEEVKTKIDKDLDELLPSRVLKDNTKLIVTSKKTNKKQKRRKEYALIQKMYRKNRSKTIRKVLDGEWKIKNSTEPKLADLEPFWRNIFEKGSEEDHRNPQCKESVVLELEAPITVEEVEYTKRSQKKDTAAGPDGITCKDVMNISSLKLAQRFNVWMFTGYIPQRNKQGLTVLIPKKKGDMRPESFRPITMMPTVIRLFHRILARRMMAQLPINKQQKAFRKGDGIAFNLITVQALLEHHTKNLKPLSGAFLDIRKAFDSVNHSSLHLACKRIGIPDMLLNYIKTLYTGSTICLRVQGEISDPICVNRGIRQGDPLSVPLFLAIMDWAIDGLNTSLGASIGKERINHLAFADDMVIFAASDLGLQYQITHLEKELSKSGLNFNPSKCSSFRLTIDGKKKKWIMNPDKFLKCAGELIPTIKIGSFYNYLGIKIGCMNNSQFVTDVLEKKLTFLTKAPFKPQQRIYTLIKHLIPSLLHPLTFMSTSNKFLKSLDLRIRSACRKWLKMPKDITKGFFHSEPGVGGLGIPQLEYRIPLLKTKRIANFCNEDNTWGNNLITEKALPNMCTKWLKSMKIDGRIITNKKELDEAISNTLHNSADGRGLKDSSTVKSSNYWVSNGSLLLSGRDYIGALACKGGYLHTGLRALRANKNNNALCDCCGRVESLGHILQSCSRTHNHRLARHNRIRDILASRVRKKDWSILKEQAIPTSAGIRRPDLIFFKDNLALVVDVTIVADTANMFEPYEHKVRYYKTTEITNWIKQETGCTDIEYGALVINWRGAICKNSYDLLDTYWKFPGDFYSLLSAITCTYGYYSWRHFKTSTYR